MTSTASTSSSTSLSHLSSTSSNFELTQDLLESARDQLLEKEETQVVLAENVSLENFLKFYLENEQDLPVKIRLEDKKVIAYEVPLTPHGVVAGYVISLA